MSPPGPVPEPDHRMPAALGERGAMTPNDGSNIWLSDRSGTSPPIASRPGQLTAAGNGFGFGNCAWHSVPVAELAIHLRPARWDDETQIRAVQRTMAAEDFEFAFDLTDDTEWADFLEDCTHRRHGSDLPAGRVPASYLVAVSGDTIVGRSSIRHQLNDNLLAVGGHIGYCVLPEFRRRGIATEILRQSLIVARAAGIDRALLTCDADNAGSRMVIERCGGVLDPDWPQTETTPPKRRYWIGCA